MKRVSYKAMLSAGTVLAALIPAAAMAQGTSTPGQPATITDAAQNQPALTPEQDIIVTASKRDTTLQEATLSVTAMSTESLRERNITEITGLNGVVPGLVVARSGGGERIITIRGVGSETPENANTQPGVSFHVDGVYIFNSIAANAAFIDVQQVEVLRGPQGTTFGQGSTGGTINVVSKQPTISGFSGGVNAGIGNYGMIKGDLALNVPFGKFAIRGAVQYLKHDGYAIATNVPGHSEYDLDDQDEIGWKVAGIWQPTDNFSITLTTIQYESDIHGAAQKNILDPNPDARVLTQDYPARSIIDTELYYGVVRLELPFAVAKSITSYQKLYSAQSWDGDHSIGDLFERNILGGFNPVANAANPLNGLGPRYDHVALWQQRTESWTQELNLASNGDGPFSWIVGGVYLWSKNPQYIVEYRARADPYARPLPVNTPFNSPLVSTVTFAELSEITREAYAAYFEGSYEFGALTLTAGIRYNHDQYSGVSDSNGGTLTSGPYLQPEVRPGLETTKWTGKAAVDYKITPDNMIYFSFTRGFKPGGINGSASGAAPQTPFVGISRGTRPTYQPEVVDSFEFGSKNSFANDTFILNGTAFYYDYSNLQFLDEDAILFGEGTANAPSAKIYGLEFEGSWRPDSHWTFDGSLSLTHGEFDADYFALDPAAAVLAQNAIGVYGTGGFFGNFFAAARARDSARANINGNRVPKIPKVQGSFSAGYTAEVGPGELTAKASVIYRGEYQYRLFNNSRFDITPDYTQVNLFFSYVPTDSDLNFSFTVTNLFDKDGINSRVSDPYGSAQTFQTYIPPRQLLFSIGYNF